MKMTLEEMDALSDEVEKAVREVASKWDDPASRHYVTGGMLAVDIMRAAILRTITTEVCDE